MKIISIVIVAAYVFTATTASAGAHYVSGYSRSNGTYVEPHYQTNPNARLNDNYSTKGNVNPYTGKAGTVDPYKVNRNVYAPNNGSIQNVQPVPYQ